MRKAGENLWEVFKNYYGSEIGQDVVETAIKGGIAATGQATLTDMTPTEIALATAIGMGGAMAARPIGKRVGRAIGRRIDRATNSEPMHELVELLERGKAHKNKFVSEASDLLNRRFMANYAKRDGELTGYAEGLLGELIRETSDDAVQLGLAVALPQLFDRMPTEEEKLQAGTQTL